MDNEDSPVEVADSGDSSEVHDSRLSAGRDSNRTTSRVLLAVPVVPALHRVLFLPALQVFQALRAVLVLLAGQQVP